MEVGKMRHFTFFTLALVLGLTLAIVTLSSYPVLAATYYVDDDTCPDMGSGTMQDPFCKIQDGIDASSSGETVKVAAGTYYENIIMKSGVLIQGDGQGVSIIDGGENGSVVTATDVDSAAKLDGFTITNGYYANGGGMNNSSSSPTVSNCTFSGNSASIVPSIGEGGGMYNVNSSPTVTNCTFSGNDATGLGGGMHNLMSSPTVTNCTFSENSAHQGGGMYNLQSSPTVTNCTFSGNSSDASAPGGGMRNEDSSPTVTNCSFFNNTAGTIGGGMFNYDHSSPIVANCIFYNNLANGGVYGGHEMANLGSSSPTVVNCTFWNEADWAMYNDNSSPTVTNCILWGHFDMIYNGAGASPVVTYSDVPYYPGTGNINADPMFVDQANGDFHLQQGSPCTDAGDNLATALPATDFEGDDRRVDDPTVPDTGSGTPPMVDMGADEYVPPAPACECDLTTDGKCDMQDWLVFGQDWGRTDCNDPGVEECECDISQDGICDMQDWLKFGEDWGRTDCPIE